MQSPEAIMTSALTSDLLWKMDAYGRAANYLSVGQLSLYGKLIEHKPYIDKHGEDRSWKWGDHK